MGEILASGTESVLLVGIDDAPPYPMQLGAPETGDFRGYEVDLLEEAARRLGLQIRYRRSLWSVIVSELASGTLDAICSAATVTEDRKREVDFCQPHLKLQLAVVRRQGSPGGKAFHRNQVGVRRGTVAEAYVRERGTSPAYLTESNDDLYLALSSAKIDVVVDDSPIATYFSRLMPGLCVVGLLPKTEATYAIMVRKGNRTLRDAVNRVLNDMQRDGTLSKFRATWLE